MNLEKHSFKSDFIYDETGEKIKGVTVTIEFIFDEIPSEKMETKYEVVGAFHKSYRVLRKYFNDKGLM